MLVFQYLSQSRLLIYGLISCPVAKSISFIYPLNTTVSMLLYISLSNIFFMTLSATEYIVWLYILFLSFSLIGIDFILSIVFLYSYLIVSGTIFLSGSK